MDRAGALKQPVRQRRFAVIDMRDDAEVARKLNRHESATMRVPLRAVNRYARSFGSPVGRSVVKPDLSYPTHSIKIGSMPKLPFSDATDLETMTAPADFAGASPFRPQRQETDRLRKAILIGLAIVLLIFLGSMIAVLMMHPPSL